MKLDESLALLESPDVGVRLDAAAQLRDSGEIGAAVIPNLIAHLRDEGTQEEEHTDWDGTVVDVTTHRVAERVTAALARLGTPAFVATVEAVKEAAPPWTFHQRSDVARHSLFRPVSRLRPHLRVHHRPMTAPTGMHYSSGRMLRSSFVVAVLVLCGGGCKEDATKNASPTREQEFARYRSEKAAADKATAAMRKDTDAAQAVLKSLQADLSEVDEKVSAAVLQLKDARTHDARSAARDHLEKLTSEQTQLRARVAEASRFYEALENAYTEQYRKMVRVPADCINNPLSKDCE